VVLDFVLWYLLNEEHTSIPIVIAEYEDLHYYFSFNALKLAHYCPFFPFHLCFLLRRLGVPVYDVIWAYNILIFFFELLYL